MNGEILLMCCIFACGVMAGLLVKCGPGSGWQALLSAGLLPPIAIWLMMTFC